jgi:hypothetical protein
MHRCVVSRSWCPGSPWMARAGAPRIAHDRVRHRILIMIVMEQRGEHLEALVWVEAPSVYMDMWALDLFSKDPALKKRFLDLFKDRGTLLISVMLAMEIGSHTGAERPELRGFLDAIGPHWAPMTIDPFAVIKAQESPGSTPGCVSTALINDAKFSKRLRSGNLSLGSVVDLTRGQDGVLLKAETDQGTKVMVDGVAHHREEYGKDPGYLDRRWRLLPYEADKYMRPIYNAFQRLCVTDGFSFSDSHARDLFHSVASVGCAHITLLDSHWAEQARKVLRMIGAPATFVKIYPKGEVEQFLDDFANYSPSRGTGRPTL